MSNQGTIRLKVTNGAPSVEKLWNGRFKLEFFCDNNSPKEDWYYDNISSILPDYGILQETNFGSGVSEDWEAIPDSVYPDMRLVETEYVFIPSMGDKRVKLTYETLTAYWVEEKSEDTDRELNGLKRVSRTFVALPGTAHDKAVGASTTNSDGTTLYLGSFKVEKTEAKWKLTEVWLEAGTLSETLDNVGSQKAKVIETIGADPATPSGYSLASKQESDFEGFQTNRFTFLKPSILSLQQDFVGGATTVQVSAFSMTEAEVDADLSRVTASHILISQSEDDYEGIKTSQFTYEVDNFEERDRVGDDLLRIQETELSASPFADGDVGRTTKLDGSTTLYLGSENIDNGNNVKRRIRIWIQAGTLNISTATESAGLNRVSTTFLHIEGTTNGPIVSRSEQNVLGLKTITVSTLERSDGQSITDERPTNTFGTMFNFTYPGIVGVSSVTTRSVQNGVTVDDAKNRFFYQSSPVQRQIPATSHVFFQLSSLPVAEDYTYGNASGLWSPSNWAGGTYYGWRYQRENFGSPIGERPSFRGFRAVEDYEIGGVSRSIIGTATDNDGLSGTLLLNGTTFGISVSGGPERPDGNTYTLGTIDIEPAFIDEDGVQYYKKVITVATIPTQGGSVIT